MDHRWIDEFSNAVTVCDLNGIILDMNGKAAMGYADRGGKQLIGSNLLDCHSDASRAQVRKLLDSKQANVYTIEKNGVKKLIYQSPWFENGACAGFVELALVIPFEMPHFIRG